MSYTVLARRYRSSTFDELVGQEQIAGTLKKAISTGKIAHAYLLCGTRGTGKTSTARILAKCLNCESATEPTIKPCGKCPTCLAIARGDDIDVIEIDAASNTGVDNVRDLISNSQFRPARSRFKVYIIDEVHMLSKSAFNALLKTLEEPPAHVKFILATTEPEKVPPTILSRCQRYDFRNIPTREIAAHLKDICKKEKIKADEEALLTIARAGAGSMRDSLSLLDRMLSSGESHLEAGDVQRMLGLPRAQLLFDLADAIGRGDPAAVLKQSDEMLSAGFSVEAMLAALSEHLRNLLILATCGPESELVDVPGLARAELANQSKQFDAVTLTQDIAVLEELRRSNRQSQSGRAMLDAALVRLALSAQFTEIADLLNRPSGGSAPVPATRPGPPGAVSPPDIQKKKPATGIDESVIPAPGAKINSPVQSRERPPATPATVPEPQSNSPPSAAAPASPLSKVDQESLWSRMLGELSPKHAASLDRARLSGISDGVAVVHFPPDRATFLKMLNANGGRQILTDLITKLLGQPVGVRFEQDLDAEPPLESSASSAPTRAATPTQTPANPPIRPTSRAVAPAAAPSENSGGRMTPELRQLAESDPLVRAVMSELGGRITSIDETAV